MRNMAFSMTTDQVRAGTKTVTRRMGWSRLQPGEHFCAVVKGMGLKKGEKVERLAVLRCVSNKPDPIRRIVMDDAYGKEEARKEGFPNLTGVGFANFFIKGHKGCTIDSSPNRIEFDYVRFLP